jgi:carboxyl-terminal processing protease
MAQNLCSVRERTVTKNLRLRPSTLAIWAAVSLAVISMACGAAGQSSETAVAAAPAASAQQAPTSPAVDAGTTDFVGSVDVPEFPAPQESALEVAPPRNVPEELIIVWEAWQLLQQDYVDRSKLDPEAFAEQAIRGMLRVLEDPQTSYVSPEVLKGSFGDVFTGDFEGIGAHVQMNAAGKVIIVSPIEGSPADKAGLRPGDIVLEVDGESIEGLSLLEAVSKIRGPRGTTVLLLVKHLGALDPVEIAVQRGVIPLTSVMLRSKPGAEFAHIRITNFYPNTADAFRETYTEAIKDGAKGLILDVRNNPGGLLKATVELASQFLEDGLVVYVEDGEGNRGEWKVSEGGVAKDIPMVVLANEGSASSSEILVGALQDHNRAKVIGTTTFGKGSVNILRPLSNEGGLYITIAHWYTPLGRLIQDEGLPPDIEVEDRDSKEADIKQLQRAIQELELMTGVQKSAKLGT